MMEGGSGEVYFLHLFKIQCIGAPCSQRLLSHFVPALFFGFGD